MLPRLTNVVEAGRLRPAGRAGRPSSIDQSTHAMSFGTIAACRFRFHAVTIGGRGNLQNMENLSSIVGQLKKERDRVQQQLSGLNAALAAFAGVYSSRGSKAAPAQGRKRRPMSAKGRAAIRRAQKARWAKVRAAKK
jgi:hypothetical protein